MNMRLPLNQTKAKSILCIPTDASVYSTRQMLTGEDSTGTFEFPNSAAYPTGSMPSSYVYVDSIDNSDRGNVSNRSGLVGISDEVSNYQFFYNGRNKSSVLYEV